MVAKSTARWLEGADIRVGGAESLQTARDSGCAWIDLLDPDEGSLERLGEVFGLHPLAIEDCLHFPQRPKIERYDDALFLIWLVPARPDGLLRAREVDVFLGKTWSITVHKEPLAALDELAKDAKVHLSRGPQWLTHSMLDHMVDNVLAVTDELEARLEDLQDKMLESASQGHLETLYGLRRDLVELHKMTSAERDVLRGLVRESDFVDAEAYRYFQDVADHLARLSDAIDTSREVAAAATDIYLSSVSNRMNQIMKQLTIMATIFMPLTLISGIYGMNFQHIPELQWRYGYPAVLTGMLVIALWMLWFFRRRDWW